MPVADLLGCIITEVQRQEEQIKFTVSDGRTMVMQHYQDCCESVYIESVTGDMSDLLNHPVLQAEEVTSSDIHPTALRMLGAREDDAPLPSNDGTYTWTFYKLATIKGGVVIRWFGTSSGYYSESVDCDWVTS